MREQTPLGSAKSAINTFVLVMPAQLWSSLTVLVLHWINVGVPLAEVLLVRWREERHMEELNWDAFTAVLSDKRRSSSLFNFAVQEFSVENMVFLQQLDELETDIANHLQRIEDREGVKGQLLGRIQAMYAEFIQQDAPSELNLTDSVQQAAKSTADVRTLTLPLFPQVKFEVQRLVFEQTYPRYLQAKLHKNEPWTLAMCCSPPRRHISTSASRDAIVLAEIAVHQHE
jgi:hypothetical protein